MARFSSSHLTGLCVALKFHLVVRDLAAISPTTMLGTIVLPTVTRGNTDAFATRKTFQAVDLQATAHHRCGWINAHSGCAALVSEGRKTATKKRLQLNF